MLDHAAVSSWYAHQGSPHAHAFGTFMAVSSIQIKQPTQRLRVLSRLSSMFLAVFVLGCQADHLEEVYGEYTINMTALAHSPLLKPMTPQRRAVVENIARPMLATTRYIFTPDGCARVVRGHESEIPCEFRRVEKSGTVVFWSQNRLGHTQFIRLSPASSDTFGPDAVKAKTLVMDIGDQRIPLMRLKTKGSNQ
jgi:hypothetical protein